MNESNATNATQAGFCWTCEVSDGLSSVETRGVIVVVVVLAVVLVLCCTGVVWFGIRTRDRDSPELIFPTTNNEAFAYDEEEDEEYVRPAKRESRASGRRVTFEIKRESMDA